MPEHVTLEVDGFGPTYFCHATPRDDEEVALVDSRIERWVEVLEPLPSETSTVVCGHTHMPFLRLHAGCRPVVGGLRRTPASDVEVLAEFGPRDGR